MTRETRTAGWIVLILGLACAGLQARQGQVATRDGQSHPGYIRLDTNRLVVANVQAGRVESIPWSQVQKIVFEPRPSRSSKHSAASLAQDWLRARPLPRDWQPADLGYAQVFNEDTFYAGLFRMRVASLPSQRQDTSWHFVSQPVSGFSELIARVVEIRPRRKGAMTGLMIRESLSESSPFAFIGLTAWQGGVVLYRRTEGAGVEVRRVPGWRHSAWLRLTRLGGRVELARAPFGQRWDVVETLEMHWGDQLYVGLAASAGPPPRTRYERGAAPVQFSLDHVRLLTSQSSDRPMARLVLTSGSVARGHIFYADGASVRYRDYLGPARLPIRRLAYIQFRYVPPTGREHIRQGRPGVVLDNGEFIEGNFRGIEQDELLLSSVPLGLRRFSVLDQVAAVIFHKPAPQLGRFEVRMLNGSVWHGVDLAIGRNEVLLTDAHAGVVRLPVYELLEVRRSE